MLDIREISKLVSAKSSHDLQQCYMNGVYHLTNFAVTRKRASENDLHINILGAGGVGSNVFTRFNISSLVNDSNINKVRFTDFDDIELHNLNRTFSFNLLDIDTTKVDALERKNLLPFTNDRLYKSSANGNSWLESVETITYPVNQIITYNVYADISERTCKKLSFSNNTIPYSSEDSILHSLFYTGSSKETSLVIDCRDTLDVETINKYTWIKLAYNGGNDLAVHFNPLNYMRNMLSSGNSTYEIVPSFYVPASILSSLPLYFMNFKCLMDLNPAKSLDDDERRKLPSGQIYFKVDETLNESSYSLQELFE